MWSMILLMSRLPGGHSMSAGRRPEKLGYQQSTVCWVIGTIRRLVPTERSDRRSRLDWILQCFTSPPTQYRLYGRRNRRSFNTISKPTLNRIDHNLFLSRTVTRRWLKATQYSDVEWTQMSTDTERQKHTKHRHTSMRLIELIWWWYTGIPPGSTL